ncbi:hypothetical protein BDR05DRAFT_946802 [Suillus weaverae]|nr:hypothetical protein BDR05DRAFT_946802 [Suillus weaverae]
MTLVIHIECLKYHPLSVRPSGALELLLLRSLFYGLPWDDILSYINKHTDASDPGRFADSPQSSDQTTSIFNFKENAWQAYGTCLLHHLVRDPTFFYKVQGVQKAKHVLMWGGGAHNFECNHLKFKINGQGQRHLFVLNGLITISTTYVKTASIQHHSKLIACCSLHSSSCLLLVVLGVIYPAAAVLSTFVMLIEKAKAYLSYIFMQDSSPMDMKKFSQSLSNITLCYIGQVIGMRDWRQIMSTMLVNILKVDFSVVDAKDNKLLVIHHAFGHFQSVADVHYALQMNNSLTEIFYIIIAPMQRVSQKWHAMIGQWENSTNLEIPISQDDRQALVDCVYAQLKTTIHNAVQHATMAMEVDVIDKLRTVAGGIGNEILKEMQDMFGHYIGVDPSISHEVSQMISLPHLAINSNLIDTLHPLFSGNPALLFTSPYQAELVQSCLTNEHVLCVMPTGSGKSLAFFAAPLLHPHGLFIVITPLIALTKDMACQLASTGIRGIYVIQAPLHQSNISYSMILVSTKQLKEKIIEIHHSIVLQERDRAIIYCMTIALIKELSELLQIPHYTSDTLLCDNCNHLKTLLHSAGISQNLSGKPFFPSPTLLTQQPLSIKSVAAAINSKYATGIEELRVLKHILETIKTIGCIYYWSKIMSLLTAGKYKDTTFWAYCYKCWVPFQEPLITVIQKSKTWIKHEPKDADEIP